MLASCARSSVCLSQASTVPKRLNVGSRKRHHMPRDSIFLTPKTRQNSDGVTPIEAPNRGGVGSN